MRSSIIVSALTITLLLQIYILHKGTKQLHAANYVMNMEMLELKKNITNQKYILIQSSKKRNELYEKYTYLHHFNVDALKHTKGNSSYFSFINYLFRLDILTRQLQMYDRYRNLQQHLENLYHEINPEILEKLSQPLVFVKVNNTKNDTISIMASHADRPSFKNQVIQFDEKYIRLSHKGTGETDRYSFSKINAYEE